MIKIPYDCPRKRNDCIALSNIVADSEASFFCCGENNGKNIHVKQDRFTLCFKGEHDHRLSYNDKRDLMHNSAVIIQALAVVEKAHEDERDWSAWEDL